MKKINQFLLACSIGFLSSAVRSEILPAVAKPVGGHVALKIKDSIEFSYDKPKDVVRPNILLVLLDDVGFASSEVFGGAIHTPTLARLASQGLRYTRFHTAGICSATRASLLSGRNHHAVGTGGVMEMGWMGFPGRTGIWPSSAAPISDVLRLNGYNTAAFGKWHNTPLDETGLMGPFDLWPTRMGFEYFYGFLGGDTNQFEPALIENTRPVERPMDVKNYHFTSDITDKAIAWMRDQKSSSKSRPFFLYFAPGATHAPHQAPKKWIEKYRGAFDQGWDRYREEAFARQKSSGIIPGNAALTPRPDEIPAWDGLPEDQKKLYARMMEAYAGFLEHTDHEVGRLFEALNELDERDNTLVIYIVGDNGGSGEGGIYGAFNEMEALLHGTRDDSHHLLHSLDEIGGPNSYPIYPAGWGWATNAPFRWVKRVVSHLGSIRNPMVVSWGKGIKNVGEIRTQFHHVVDIVPTILEVTGIEQPAEVNGANQQPLDGISLAYTFSRKGAGAAEPLRTQYFEVEGNKGIYHAGWFASEKVALPWSAPMVNASGDPHHWELYDLDADFSQQFDLAKNMPKKLREMEDLWWAEAGKNKVLPVVTTSEAIARGAAQGEVDRSYVFYPSDLRTPSALAPPLSARSYSIVVDAELPIEKLAQGVLLAYGGRFGGYSLFFRDGKLSYRYSLFGNKTYSIDSRGAVAGGKNIIRLTMKCQDKGCTQAKGRLFVNEKLVGGGDVSGVNMVASWEGFNIGRDSGTAIDSEYQVPFKFNGRIKNVKFSFN